MIDLNNTAEMIITIILLFLVFEVGIYTVVNIISAIVQYKRPELYCAKCGKRLSRKAKKCPKCNVRLKF